MTPVILLALIVAVPIFLLVLLRINAAIVFLSLCLGDVLVQFVSKDTQSLAEVFSPNASNRMVKLLLVLAPAVLTSIFMLGTVKKRKLSLNILPAIGVGLLAALLIVPLLSPDTASRIIELKVWSQVKQSQGMVVGISAVVSLLFLWMQRPIKSEKGHGKKHH